MATVIDSLLVRLGFQTDPKGLEGFAKVAEQAKGIALGLAGAISGAVYGLESLVKSAAEGMGGVQVFAERVGMSAREVAAFGAVAAANHSSLEAMEGTISNMNALLGQAAAGFPRAEKMLGRFGLKAKNEATGNLKTFDELFGEVADKMKDMTVGGRTALANVLGIDHNLIPLLSKGREEFARLKAEAMAGSPFSEQDYENAEKLDKSFMKAERSVGRLKKMLAVGLFPTVENVLKKFTAWTSNKENIDKISGAVQKLVQVAGFLWKHIDMIVGGIALLKVHKIGSMFLDWGGQVGKLASSLKVAGGASSMLTAGLNGLKGILTGGLLVAIAAVAEDLYVFSQGGESFTGWLTEKFPPAVDYMKAALAALGGAFVALSTGSGPLGAFVAGISGLIIAGLDLKENWGVVLQWLGEQWDAFVDSVNNGINTLSAPIRGIASWFGAGEDWGKLDIKGPQNAARTIASGAGSEAEMNRVSLAQHLRSGAPGMGVLAPDAGNMMSWGRVRSSSSYTDNSTTTHHTVIQINGAQDPQAVRREVGAELDKRQSRAEAAGSARARTRNAQGATVL
jgi:hypothetical protein